MRCYDDDTFELNILFDMLMYRPVRRLNTIWVMDVVNGELILSC